jgi:hypothetical protein
MAGLINALDPLRENLMSYILYPGQPISLPIFHCKRCHHTSRPRSESGPKHCPNTQCATQRWNQWPDDFDPANIECSHCKILWEMEKQGIKPPPPKPRGRPPKA